MIFVDVFSGLSGEKDTVLATPAPPLLILKPHPHHVYVISLITGSHVVRQLLIRDSIFEDAVAVAVASEGDATSASEAVSEGAQGLFPSRHHVLAQLQLFPRQGRRLCMCRLS